MIDLSQDYQINELWGEISSENVIFFDASLNVAMNEIDSVLKRNFLKYFAEVFPSGILIRQIFNDKVRLGKLILDKPPKVVILPSNDMKALKEWDIVFAVKPLCKLKPSLIYIKKNEWKTLGIPDPNFSPLGKIGLDYGKEYELRKYILYNKDIPSAIKRREIDIGVMWAHEGKEYGFEVSELNKSITLEIGLIKGFGKFSERAFEIILSEGKEILKSHHLEVFT
ncbi:MULTISPECIES: hypothetical protein [Acidianus]|uniref:Uncharacterized protein n=1 Tax=Candidatus Acidianus copahuensis TaxID=1160895 RepID=A0A031LIY7_9CREN|nr:MULTISPECIES: hypothetical protein [Acidianus]EZQ02112.1 hypothetical protein CM19_10930 [Candidatus Acidianus copahuensis]NON62496.1 hypothetical protein [Acidianus sp. RZ1]